MNMTNRKRILVVGSYNAGFLCRTPRMPVWGETLLGEGFAIFDGGKGSNQAVAAARLGGDVTFVGCVGDDDYGKAGLQLLRNEGIDTRFVQVTDKAHTGVGFVFLNEKGDNCIIVDPGANHLLSPEAFPVSAFGQADLVVVQLENRIDTIRFVMQECRRLGKPVILNPAPAAAGAEALAGLAAIVTPNESELMILNGLDPSQSPDTEQCEELARKMLGSGPEAVIVTRGEKGALLVTRDRPATEFRAPEVHPVDTTGAGDSFTGALAVALSENKRIDEAVQFACYVGAYCVTREGVIPALPRRAELESFIRYHEKLSDR